MIATIETPDDALPRNVILHGDCRAVMRILPAASVQLVVTSPPYYGLRSYGTEPQVWGGREDCVHVWGDKQRTPWANSVPGPNGQRKNSDASHWQTKEGGAFCQLCNAWRGEFGQEQMLTCDRTASPDRCGVCYVCHMVDVFRDVRRVLRADGQVYLNLGDGYANNPSTSRMRRSEQGNGMGVFRVPDEQHVQVRRQTPNRLTALKHGGLKHKDLMMVPHRCAIALQQDGWWVRNDNVWAKENALPESVTDRTTRNHEYVFQLTKSERYHYDHIAIAEPAVSGYNGSSFTKGKTLAAASPLSVVGTKPREETDTRNRRSVWRIPTAQFAAAHFAVMPEEIAEIAIKCGTSPYACEVCGAPWKRVTKRQKMQVRSGPRSGRYGSRTTDGISGTMVAPAIVVTVGWQPTCRCEGTTGSGRCVVLDPFGGSGTVGDVAQRLDRDYLLIDLQGEYIPLAKRRIRTAGCAHTTVALPQDAPEQIALFDAIGQ